jgi:hypothetical protein
MASRPRGGPSTSRSTIACRMLPGLRSNAPNDPVGRVRDFSALLVVFTSGTEAAGTARGGVKVESCGSAVATGGGATSITTGSGGVVVRGGNGCTKLRRTLGGRCGCGTGETAGRGATERWRIGGGGCVPGGAPSASRKRRTRSSSLCAGGRREAGSLGGGASGFSGSPAAWLLSHLKTSATPAKARKISVSFIRRS